MIADSDAGGAVALAGSNATEASSKSSGSSGGAQPTSQQLEQRFGKRGSGQAFALGLFQILKTEDPKVIGWSASGKAFRIGDSDKFCKEIMPRFFKQNKYSSFQRQLNLYGFRKLVRGNEAGGYMHPLFERGKPEQLSQVRRGFFPEIPPEFAHDVHGHGLNDGASGAGGGGDGGGLAAPSKTAGRRKSETSRSNGGGGGGGSKGSGGGAGGRRGGGDEQSPSMGQAGMLPASAAGSAAETAVAAGGRGGGVHRRGPSGQIFFGQTDGTNVHNGRWDGGHDPLPSLDSVTGGLRNLHGGGRHGNGSRGQGKVGEMAPSLGSLHLSPSAETSVTGGSSPITLGGASSSSNLQHLASRGGGGGGLQTPYGRSQDDLNLSPRSYFANPIMGPGGANSGLLAGQWAAGPVHGGGGGGGSGGGSMGNLEQLLASNGSGFGMSNSGVSLHLHDPSGRPLQHMHSRDDLDALRPRKTRRTGPSFDQDQDHPSADQQRAFLAAMSKNGGSGNNRAGNGRLFAGERGGFLNTSGLYGTDETSSSAPRQLVSKLNTPSRPEHTGADNGSGGGGGGGGGGGDEGRKMGLQLIDPSSMDLEGGARAGGPLTAPGFQLAAHGFYAAMSPVVAPGRGGSGGGFGGGRRHQRHCSSSTQQGSSGDAGSAAATPQWQMGEVSPEDKSGRGLQGDSPSSSRSGGGGSSSGASGGGGGGGILGVGGLGLTPHAMTRMQQMKASQRALNAGGGQQVQALGENLSQLDISEHSRNELYRQHRAMAGGGDGSERAVQQQQHQHQHQSQQQSHKQHLHQLQNQHQHQQRPQPNYSQPLRDSGCAGRGGLARGASERRPTTAEAAELLRRRSSVDEVIALLSGPAAGDFEDETTRSQQCDPAQFDSWRNYLTKVLGHLGFDFEDEQGAPLHHVIGPDGKRSPTNKSKRGNSQYLHWGGTSAMSFEDRPEEFHESLRQIPMRWRSSLSSIMTSMASNGGFDDHGGAPGGATGGASNGMNVSGTGGGKSGAAGERKLEQQASLEMLQSVMRETLESMSSNGGGEGGGGGVLGQGMIRQQATAAEDGAEEEAKAAAEAALAMGSMCRAKDNDDANGGGAGGGRPLSIGSTCSGRGGNGRPLSVGSLGSGMPGGGLDYAAGGSPASGGMSPGAVGAVSASAGAGGGQHVRRSSQADLYYMQSRKQQHHHQFALAGEGGGGDGGGGGGGLRHEHQTPF